MKEKSNNFINAMAEINNAIDAWIWENNALELDNSVLRTAN